ncbi:MAG: glycosyltransferase family 2 protein [Armatimonadetes bacterium]|nr:glycosyltransferase family 2 protein [Armatimonadota bacterium]
MSVPVSYVIITHNRAADLTEALQSILRQQYAPLEIVVLDNASTDETPRLFAGPFNLPNIRYLRSETNLGVSGGRNLALEHATGELLVTIDDDSILRDPDATTKMVRRLQSEPDLGVLTFRVVDYWSGELEAGAFPWKDKKRDATREFETTWFIGTGHIIPRAVYERVGLYQEYFPYGCEEIDLALRILDAGYRIRYFPQVTVHHKKVTTRHTWRTTRFQAMHLQNRVKVAIRNLPWQYVLTTDLVRSAQVVLKHSRGNLAAVLLAHWYLARQMPRLLRERKPIGRETVRRVLKLKGPVLY